MEQYEKFKIKQAMTRMPFTIAPGVPVVEAKKVMNDFGIRHLPVLERGDLTGVISDRDIRSAESFQGPGWLSVGEVMSPEPYVVSPNTPLVEVLSEMIERKIGSALVVSPTGVTIGIFTVYDALYLLRDLLKDKNEEEQ